MISSKHGNISKLCMLQNPLEFLKKINICVYNILSYRTVNVFTKFKTNVDSSVMIFVINWRMHFNDNWSNILSLPVTAGVSLQRIPH